MNNILEPKSVESLLGYTFFVGSYQRGYRWGVQEVTALLNDINEAKGEKYWLQPIIVKKTEENSYELIDGQQRITTCFLILKSLGHIKKIDRITYKTRQDSNKNFFDKVDSLSKYNNWSEFVANPENKEFDKIDNYHLFTAYKTINEWLKEKNVNESFKKAFLEKVYVIWYEVADKSADVKEIFENVNIGKIPLTNAELVKALYLNSKVDEDRQKEIAQKWARIEFSLQEPKLWSFITNTVEQKHNRIEFILDLVSGKTFLSTSKEERLHTFIYFLNSSNLDESWSRVEKYFEMFLEWFRNPELYHYVGYIITTNFESIRNLADKYIGVNSKKKFIEVVKEIIRNKIIKIDQDSIQYSSNNKEITDILLLFNIQSNLNSSPYIYFPFDKYKEGGRVWSLEHIHAQHSVKLGSLDAKISWLNEQIELLDKCKSISGVNMLIEKLAAEKNKGANIKLEDLEAELFYFFSGDGDNSDLKSEMHKLSNLALLSARDNSSLNNDIFLGKSEKLFELEKSGSFIPNCTKMVFLKYYSKDKGKMHFWGSEDRKDYLESINDCLKCFTN